MSARSVLAGKLEMWLTRSGYGRQYIASDLQKFGAGQARVILFSPGQGLDCKLIIVTPTDLRLYAKHPSLDGGRTFRSEEAFETWLKSAFPSTPLGNNAEASQR